MSPEDFEQKIRKFPNTYLYYIYERVCAADRYHDAMVEWFKKEERSAGEFFDLLTAFLDASAAVSRVLFDPGRQAERKLGEVRVRILQEMLDVSSSSTISDRSWRNHLIHYETRIDDWLVKSTGNRIARRNIEKYEGMIRNFTADEIFELFDPYEWVFYFRGEKYPIHDIRVAVFEIGFKIEDLEQFR